MKKDNNKNPFKTPEDYFEGFADRLFTRLDEDVANIPNPKDDMGEGFTTPDGYFNELHKNIQKKIDKENTKLVQLHPYRKYYMAAASIAAIALIFFGLNRKTTETLTFDDLASSDIESYLETNELGLSTYQIAEVLPIDDLEISDILEHKFDEENFVEYLDESIDDFEELNLEDYE